MAVLIPAEGAMTHLKPPRQKWGYRDLQKVVGGVFEILWPQHNPGCGQALVVRENAAVLGLPVNRQATELWRGWGGRGSLRGVVMLVKVSEIE